MKAMVFLRRKGTLGIGHAAWAFQHPDGSWNTGSVENQPHTPYTPPDLMGWWLQRTGDPLAPMRERRYEKYKVLDVPTPNAVAATAEVERISREPYRVDDQNCMHDAYEVLTAYGATLPDPTRAANSAPAEWFEHIPGEPREVGKKKGRAA
jgi:hypothetical protein